MHNKVKDLAFFGMCVSLALALAYVEVLLEPLFQVAPGVRMGLPNLILIFLLYRRGVVPAATVSLIRIVLVSLLFGKFILYPLVGGILSMAVMAILKRFNLLSITGISVAGGVTHNLGQILVAMWLMDTTALGYYFIVLAISGTISGIFIGLGSAQLIRRIPAKW